MFAGINSLKGKALLAPMAGISNLPFRLIARSFGCALAFTEMISANGIIRKSDRTLEYLRTCADDNPLGAQIFGADPEIMAEASCIIADHGVDLIDINMGCPVKKVIKAGAGAILMKDPDRVSKIIRAVKKAVRIPVTVKIRSGWTRSSINAVEIARVAEKSGADAIIVHGRTADHGFGGVADLGWLTPQIGLEADLLYWSKSYNSGYFYETYNVSYSQFSIDALAKYYFEQKKGSKFHPYAGGGLGLGFWKVSYPESAHFAGGVSGTDIVISLLAGSKMALSPKMDGFAEVRYSLGGYDFWGLFAGFVYKLK